MSDNVISTVLLAYFDQSQKGDVEKFKGALQGNQDIEVLDFDDIQTMYTRLSSYVSKLKLALDEAKLAILITPSDVTAIQDNDKLIAAIKSVYVADFDAATSKAFLDFLSIESDAQITNSKLVFLSIGEKNTLPEAYGSVEHVNDILTRSDEGVDTNKDNLKRLLTKCKNDQRKTFPEEGKEVKKKDCSVM